MTAHTLAGRIWAVSVPIIFAELSETVLHVTDTIFLARVGTAELAALALADSILELWIVLAIGLAEAMQVIIARRAGQHRERAIGNTFNQGLLLIAVVSLLLTAALKLAAPHLTGQIVQSQDVAAATDAFLQIAAYGIVFYSASLAYSVLYVGLMKTRVLIYATVVLALTNLALGYILIFGKLGMPGLGIRGAALGTIGAELAAFVFLNIYTRRRLDVGRYGLFQLKPWDNQLVRSLMRVSVPAALQALMEGLRWLIFFLILERLSYQALAWSNILYACYTVLLIPAMAFAETACSTVSNLIGHGRATQIGLLMRQLLSPTYLITVPFLALALLVPHLVLSAFTSDPTVIDNSVAGLRTIALGMLVIIPGELWFAAVFGTGDTDAGFIIELALTTTMLVCSYLTAFVLHLSLVYIWISLPLAWLICLILSHAWVTQGYWKRRQI
jgi:MATE family multidrug resistance protein